MKNIEATWTTTPVPDAIATEHFYAAVLRDRSSWNVITNCSHEHRSRAAAEKCADTFLRRAAR